jgi:hypothetical protein
MTLLHRNILIGGILIIALSFIVGIISQESDVLSPWTAVIIFVVAILAWVIFTIVHFIMRIKQISAQPTTVRDPTKVPAGIILLLILVGLNGLSILWSLRNPAIQLGQLLLTGVSALPIILIMFTVLGIIFYGIIRRYAWARMIAICWYVFTMLLAIVNLISFIMNNAMYDQFYSETLGAELASKIPPFATTIMLVSSLFFSLVFGIIIVSYLKMKKDYFNRA